MLPDSAVRYTQLHFYSSAVFLQLPVGLPQVGLSVILWHCSLVCEDSLVILSKSSCSTYIQFHYCFSVLDVCYGGGSAAQY